MAKAKYDQNTFPLLAEQYARQGLNDKQIANNLGINVSTLYAYQNKYSEFSEAVTRGKRPANIEVENSLKKAATGYTFEELHEEGTVKIEDGAEVFVVTRRKRVLKEVQPNVRAAETWLFNRDPERWKDHAKLEVTGSADTIAGFVKAAKIAADKAEDEEDETVPEK